MTWPFVSRHVFVTDQQHAQDVIRELAAQRDYWRTRAERLMDAALARANAIHEPTMVEKKIDKSLNPASVYTAALSVSEIDSSKGKGTGHTHGI